MNPCVSRANRCSGNKWHYEVHADPLEDQQELIAVLLSGHCEALLGHEGGIKEYKHRAVMKNKERCCARCQW